MPFALLTIGVLLLVAGARGTQDDLFNLVKGDFTGSDKGQSYVHWIVAIVLIGALGYISALKNLSRAFLILVIVVLFIKNGGVIQKFNQQIFAKVETPKQEGKN
jgi:general stress protein CsbA